MSEYNIKEQGYELDSVISVTKAFEKAFEKCMENGGGRVYVPAGNYTVSYIRLVSHSELYLEAGAYIKFDDDPESLPIVRSRWEGKESEVYTPLIFAENEEYCSITGRGIFDGNGSRWWEAHNKKELSHPRPRLVCFQNCHDIVIEGVSFINSPAWTINPVLCSNVEIKGITIRNPYNAPNTDGINPDSCEFVHVSNCHVDVGDDCVTLKSGIETEEKKVPCRNIVIENCTMAHGHGAIVIGSEMSGGVKNVTVSNCVFEGTDRGLRIKTRRGRGGAVENLSFCNIIMEDVICPIVMNMYYCCNGGRGNMKVADKNPLPVDASTPKFRNLSFSGIIATGAKAAAGFFYGLPESPIENVSLSNISVTMAKEAEPAEPAMMEGMAPMAKKGILIGNTRDFSFDKVRVFDCDGDEISEII